jgi:hypothetical protein
MKLIICGNGLDMHVGLKTNYGAYRDYLKNKKFIDGKNAISLIESSCFFIPRRKDCWTDLEESLAFDYEEYIRQMLDAFDRDIDPNNRQTSIDQINAANKFQKQSPRNIARDFTNEWFWEWIAKTYYQNIDSIRISKKDILYNIIDAGCVFLNFNYTHTLEDVFGVDSNKILYIHNRLPDKRDLSEKINIEQDILAMGRKQFQFGSTKNNLKEWMKTLEDVKFKSKGKLIKKKSIENEIKEIYYSFSKNLELNYPKLQEFIRMYDIEEVIVLGHSVLGVDEPYYRDVIVPVLKAKKWKLFWHNSSDEIEKFSKKYGLDSKIYEW